MAVPLSVFIITHNEEARLGRTLAAVDWAGQVVVVDSGSTDATLRIAREAGAEVHHRDWQGYGPQKAFAESLCKHDWLLNLDADEVVTPALGKEIRTQLAGRPAAGAFRVRILNVYPGRDRPRWLANDYNEVRLYHRSVARYRDHPLFDRVESDVPTGQLRAPVHHFPLLSWAHMVEKENAYTTFVAAAARPRSRRALLWRLPFEMPLAFMRFYFARRHVTGGWRGFMFSLCAAFARTLRIAKMLDGAAASPSAGTASGKDDALGEDRVDRGGAAP